MKKLIVSLVLGISVLGSAAFANEYETMVGESPLVVTNRIQSGESAWVTIYNVFGRISDVGCVPQYRTAVFQGYMTTPIPFRVRIEVKAGPSCGGATIYDDSLHFFGSGTTYVDGARGKGFSLTKGTE